MTLRQSDTTVLVILGAGLFVAACLIALANPLSPRVEESSEQDEPHILRKKGML